MGDPKKRKNQFEKPLRPWDRGRLEKEKELKKSFGLKNKRELWMVETILRKKRKSARSLLALELEAREKMEKELIKSIAKYGIISEMAVLDDVLGLGAESFLERRLQTIVWRKGLASTIGQARQFVVHGHIAVNGRKVDRPSYLLKSGEEDSVFYYKKKMILEEKKSAKEKLKEEFEKAKPEELEEAEGEAIEETEAAEEEIAGETPEEKEEKGVVME